MLASDSCPVCGMVADTEVDIIKHQKMSFHFCSEQCRETFATHPSLYRSSYGKKRSARVKRRTIRLTERLDNEIVEPLTSYLMALMGVKGVVVEGDKVHITYDLLQVTERQVEKALLEVGVLLGEGWLERFRRGWVHDSEEIELDNLAAPSAPCCNRAPHRT